MNKELRELLDAINEKKALVQKLAAEDKLDDAAEEKKELVKMQQKFDLLYDLQEQQFDNMQQQLQDNGKIDGVKQMTPANDEGPKDSTKEFANAARNGFVNSMSEGAKTDGGYTVPEDIETKIQERRTAKASLIEEVDVEVVTTNKGARTFKKRSQQTGFTKVGEGGKITGKNTPQFERLEYEIAKYAGYFPVTNELLEDSDANIAGTLISWIGDESRVTRNKLILAVLAAKGTETFKGLDDVKKAVNVTLGQAFKATSKIITNDDGLQYFDTLKDANGRDLLQPNPTEPGKMQLRAGATIIPIKVIPNEDMPSDTATAGKRKIPVIIGDLKEAVKFFDRKQTTIATSTTAAIGDFNAFEEDLTLYRAIEREDVKMKDKAAYVNGVIEIDDSAVAGE